MTNQAKTIAKRDCDQCKAEYLPKTDRSHFCSAKCQQRAKYYKNPYNKETFGTGTTSNRGRVQTAEHIKKRAESLAISLASTTRNCVKCGDAYVPTVAAQKYCSGRCWNSVARKRKESKQAISIHKDHYAVLFDLQDGKCKICSSPSGADGRGSKLAVDHCHTTGHIRGLLCHRCNTALGLLRDDTGNLQAAIAYLNESRARHTTLEE